MKNIFVGNLSFQTTEASLRSAFEAFGEVQKVNVVTDRDTGRPRGFAFVEMANTEEADRAVASLNGKDFDGRSITVNEARPRPERSFSAGRGGQRSDFGGGRRREPRW